jgi:hypothetical protein
MRKIGRMIFCWSLTCVCICCQFYQLFADRRIVATRLDLRPAHPLFIVYHSPIDIDHRSRIWCGRISARSLFSYAHGRGLAHLQCARDFSNQLTDCDDHSL